MTPTVRFLGQPFDPADAAAAFFAQALDEAGAERLVIAVAWARGRALIRLADTLDAFRARGGHAKLLVGIDEGVATSPGLELALELFDEVSIVHDLGGRTFHPKVYLVEGARSARLLVGSSNLTAGGLYFNFEASTEVRFTLPEDDDHPALTGVRAFFAALEADAATRRLTADRLAALLADPHVRIAKSEQRTGRRRTVTGIDVDELDMPAEEEPERVVFARSSGARSHPPRLEPRQRQRLRELDGATAAPPRGARRRRARRAAPPPPVGTVLASWSKRLSASDAKRPPSARSQTTAVLRLTRGQGPDKLPKLWFRSVLFGTCAWLPRTNRNGRPIEWTAVPMDVTFAGRALGILELEVDHGAHREADQGNVVTTLHWGPVLGEQLRRRNMSGETVTIERLASGSFRLTIA